MRAFLVVAACAAFLVPLAGAEHPDTHSGPGGVCPPEVQTLPDDDAGPVYVTVDDFWAGDWVFSFWIYLESNGVPGLQRHDGYCYTAGYNNDSLRDTLVF